MKLRNTRAFTCVLVWALFIAPTLNAGTGRGKHWRSIFSGTVWHTQSYSDIEGYSTRPTEDVVRASTVEWQEPELDHLGNICTIRGQLKQAGDQRKVSQSIDWFQGLTVYMANVSGAKPDWSKGITENNGLAETTIVEPDGTFEVTMDIRKTQQDRMRPQSFQLGLALAKHTIKAADRQDILWDSQAPVVPITVRMLAIPAAPQLSNELDLLNRANGWPLFHHDGLSFIRAVNALQPLGKDQSLALLEEYVKLLDTHRQYSIDEKLTVIWVVRTLFEPMHAENPFPALHKLATDSRLDRTIVVGDIPFLLRVPIWLKGSPEHPLAHLKWARSHGKIRVQPLEPMSNPLETAQAFLESDQLTWLLDTLFKDYDERERVELLKSKREELVHMMRGQALYLVRDVLPADFKSFDHPTGDRSWTISLHEAKRRKIQWSIERQEFVSTAK